MPQYAALDVSNEETAIHVVDEIGTTVWRDKRASDPDVLPRPCGVTRPTSCASA